MERQRRKHLEPHNARLVRERIAEAVQQLTRHPESGRPWRIDGTRELVIPHTAHIAVYRITNRTLEIITFIHRERPQGTPGFSPEGNEASADEAGAGVGR